MKPHGDAAVRMVNRGGRPRVDQPQSTVSTRLPPAYHDRLIQIANQRDMKVAALVRELLIFRLRPLP